jgi:hypothetical protein
MTPVLTSAWETIMEEKPSIHWKKRAWGGTVDGLAGSDIENSLYKVWANTLQ